MSWAQWQGMPPPGGMPMVNPAPAVINQATAPMPVGVQYTPEQWQQMQQQNWQQWAQWQQQYQQWHQQYGAEYQKSLSAMAGTASAPIPPMPNTSAPPPLPEQKPPLPPEEPPPVPPAPTTPTKATSNFQGYSSVAPTQPPLPNYSTAPPPTKPQNTPAPLWKGQPNMSNPPPNFNQNAGMKRPFTNNNINKTQNEYHDPKRNKFEQSWITHPLPNLTQKPPPNSNVNNNTHSNNGNSTEELSESEKKFMKQFAEWEAQFNKWKEQNQDHPDKAQYKEYEKKWEAWRNQLLERREQMRRRRLGLLGNAPDKLTKLPLAHENIVNVDINKPPPNMNNEPLQFTKPPEEVIEAAEENLFFKSKQADGIPGLDLVDESCTAEKDEHESPKLVEEVVVNSSVKIKGTDLEALSKNINNILGDEKLLSMLNLVTKKQNIPVEADLTTLPSLILPASENDDVSRGSFKQEETKNQVDNETRDDKSRWEPPPPNNEWEDDNFISSRSNEGFNRDYNNYDQGDVDLRGNQRFNSYDGRHNRNDNFDDSCNSGPGGFRNDFNMGRDRSGNFRRDFSSSHNRFNENFNEYKGQDNFNNEYSMQRPKFNETNRFNARNIDNGRGNFGTWEDPKSNKDFPDGDNFNERLYDKSNEFNNSNRLNNPLPSTNKEQQFEKGFNKQNSDSLSRVPSMSCFDAEQFADGTDNLNNYDQGNEYPDDYETRDSFSRGHNEMDSNVHDNWEGNDYYDSNKDESYPIDNVDVPNDENAIEDDMLTIDKVIDYDHKPIKPAVIEVSIAPPRLFDYRHKPVNRIPIPDRPKWLLDSFKNYPEFEPCIGRAPMAFNRSSRVDRMNYRSEPNVGGSRYDNYSTYNRRTHDDRVFEDKRYNNTGRFDEYGRNAKIDQKNNDRNDRFDEFMRNHKPNQRNMDRDDRFDDYGRNLNMGLRNTDRDNRFDELGRNSKMDSRSNDREDDRFNEYGKKPKIDLRNDRFEEFGRKSDYLKTDRRHNEYDYESLRRRDTILPVMSIEKSNISKNQPQINVKIIAIDDILNPPGRFKRPAKIVIILRGPPGSGKTFLAKLIKDKELESGGSAPRILSLDDYFMVEQEREIKEDGKAIIIKEMVYEYEDCMEGSYRTSLLKSFKKTVTDGYFPFIIVDNVNEKTQYFEEMWSFARQNGFQVYVCQLELDVQVCTKRNIHNRSKDDIEQIVLSWEDTPTHYFILDATSLIQAGSIPDVEMEEINSPNDTFGEDENEEQACNSSKWDNFECSIDNLAKLDGINKPLRSTSTMEDFLQLDEWSAKLSSKPGQKRVRWADLEEQKEQEKMRAIGFVVGQTDWDRMMDPTQGGSALTKTKYIERVHKY